MRKEFALNKRGSNLEKQESVFAGEASLLVAGARCEQDWEEQNRDQFNIMIENAQNRNNQNALASYQGLLYTATVLWKRVT